MYSQKSSKPKSLATPVIYIYITVYIDIYISLNGPREQVPRSPLEGAVDNDSELTVPLFLHHLSGL